MSVSMNNFRVYAVLPASDVERAKLWYEEKLGLTHQKAEFGSYWYECSGGTWIVLTPSQFAGTAQNTAVGWTVEDIETLMEDLRSRGVVFEEYDQPGFKTDNGLYSMGPVRAAWFKDSEGNTLEISQVILGPKTPPSKPGPAFRS